MAKRTAFFLAGIMMVLCGTANAKPERDMRVPVTVSVFNDAQVSPEVMEKARARAEAVLEAAGVQLVWLDCGYGGSRPAGIECAALEYPQHLSVRLVGKPVAVSKETFGQSYLDSKGEGNYASVYVAALGASKAAGMLGEGNLIGTVIAHELGHLLLGKNSHAEGGLMRAVWQAGELQRAATGQLLFSPSEKNEIRRRYLWANARLSGTVTTASSGK